MFNQGFNKPPSQKDLKEYSRVEMQGKRDQLASWLVGLRQMRREDPERAKNYIPPKESIKRFYEEVAKEYKALPFTKEEIEEKFSAENLSSLSLEEYAELLKRVPPRFILHITRQGVRDRVSFHSGRGEMSDGFKKILSDGKIKSKLEQYLGEIIEKDSVRSLFENYLRIPGDYPTKKEAASRVTDFLTRHIGTNLAFSEVADVSAVHASMDYVGEEFYGGEPGNEIFFLYPTAYVASQYRIADQWDTPAGFNMKESTMGSQYNDLWLKTKSQNKGELPVNASIVFIPKNTKVDPKTGSKYKIGSDSTPIQSENESFQLVDPETAMDSSEYWEQYFEKSGKRPSKIIYYEEATPNEALEAFKINAGITDDQHKDIDLKSLFAENIMDTNKEMHLQMQEEIEIIARYSEELLWEYYT